MEHSPNGIYKKNGFTLIEIIIVFGIINFFLVFIFTSISLVLKLYRINSSLTKLKLDAGTILNSVRYNIKQNAIEVFLDPDLAQKCTVDNPIVNSNRLYFLDKKGNKFGYYLSNNNFASYSGILDKNFFLNSGETKIIDLELSCIQNNELIPPLISIKFKINENINSYNNEAQEMFFSTKVKMKNY